MHQSYYMSDDLNSIGLPPDPMVIETARDYFTPFNFKKGQLILRKGQVCQHLYFLQKGLVRCFIPGEERTLWCEFENNFFFIPQSFFHQLPATESLVCLELSEGVRISYIHLEKLYRENHQWAQWGLAFMKDQYLKIETIYTSLLYRSATERYTTLLKAQPDVLQRVPLQYIASFLGVTPVSLSRIRAGRQVSVERGKDFNIC